MEITKIGFIIVFDTINPLLFAALETDDDCYSISILSLYSLGSFSQAFAAETACSFIC